jgi:hypothetical protein
MHYACQARAIRALAHQPVEPPAKSLMSDETFKQRADEENGQMVSVCSLPNERNSMTREQAIEIARHCAKAKPQSYYSEPFQPHEWVIDAILLGVRLHGAQYVPADAAKELRALSAKWRPKGVHIYESDGASRDPSCKVCGQDYSDPRHNTDKAECADELDAVLALLNG